MVETGELKKDKPIVISVSKDLVEILDEVKKYIIDYSYGSLNPSYYEASKLLAYKLKKKGKIL
jgi:hypothetical protein